MSCFGTAGQLLHSTIAAGSVAAFCFYFARNRRVDESSRFVIDARSTFLFWPGQGRKKKKAGTAPRPGRRVTIPSGAFPCNPRSLTGTCALPQTASWPFGGGESISHLAFPRATTTLEFSSPRRTEIALPKSRSPPFSARGERRIVE